MINMKTNTVIPLLKRAYAAELETVQNYLANSIWLEGPRAQKVVAALAGDVADELDHARELARRLKELGACPPGSLALHRNQDTLQPMADPTDVRHVVVGVLAAERDAIATYQTIVTECADTDPATSALAARILADEEKHRGLFEKFLERLDREFKAA